MEAAHTSSADEAYVWEAILDPSAKIVAGHAPTMPTYAAQLSDAELVRLLDYLKGL